MTARRLRHRSPSRRRQTRRMMDKTAATASVRTGRSRPATSSVGHRPKQPGRGPAVPAERQQSCLRCRPGRRRPVGKVIATEHGRSVVAASRGDSPAAPVDVTEHLMKSRRCDAQFQRPELRGSCTVVGANGNEPRRYQLPGRSERTTRSDLVSQVVHSRHCPHDAGAKCWGKAVFRADRPQVVLGPWVESDQRSKQQHEPFQLRQPVLSDQLVNAQYEARFRCRGQTAFKDALAVGFSLSRFCPLAARPIKVPGPAAKRPRRLTGSEH